MNILIACEESQRVCTEFRKKGHDAFSCDIIECSGGHPEWHIQQDVIPLLNGDCSFKTLDGEIHEIHGEWDMIIAFPPCTHLAVSGAPHFKKKRENGKQEDGIMFFCSFLNIKCKKVVIENPIGIISGNYIEEHFPEIAREYGLPLKPTQIVHPWQFGDEYEKSTCLWIKGLPELQPTNIVSKGEFFEWIGKDGRKKRQAKWFYDALRNAKTSEERSKIRSKTFPGIAKAMAEQWS